MRTFDDNGVPVFQCVNPDGKILPALVDNDGIIQTTINKSSVTDVPYKSFNENIHPVAIGITSTRNLKNLRIDHDRKFIVN
jgi:hypothetical protein